MKSTLCSLLLVLPILSWADEAKILPYLQQTGAAKYKYRETRLMELLEAPVQAQGYMLTDADGTLVKLQLLPSRVIMAIAGQTMFYWDPAQKQRHSAPLSYGGAAVEQISVFRGILNGRIEELKTRYDLTEESDGARWNLRLTPKPEQAHSDVSSIEISGDMEDKQRHIEILQSDGESTEYVVTKITDDQAASYSIAGLLREATGD